MELCPRSSPPGSGRFAVRQLPRQRIVPLDQNRQIDRQEMSVAHDDTSVDDAERNLRRRAEYQRRQRIMARTGAAEVVVSEHDILDGLLWSAVERAS